MQTFPGEGWWGRAAQLEPAKPPPEVTLGAKSGVALKEKFHLDVEPEMVFMKALSLTPCSSFAESAVASEVKHMSGTCDGSRLVPVDAARLGKRNARRG